MGWWWGEIVPPLRSSITDTESDLHRYTYLRHCHQHCQRMKRQNLSQLTFFLSRCKSRARLRQRPEPSTFARTHRKTQRPMQIFYFIQIFFFYHFFFFRSWHARPTSGATFVWKIILCIMENDENQNNKKWNQTNRHLPRASHIMQSHRRHYITIIRRTFGVGWATSTTM